ncbi:amidohydrolase family protein [Bacillus sp. C1]
MYPTSNRLDREQALRMYTAGNAWFSAEEEIKGQIKKGQYADLSILSANYFRVPDEEIKRIESVLTVVGVMSHKSHMHNCNHHHHHGSGFCDLDCFVF